MSNLRLIHTHTELTFMIHKSPIPAEYQRKTVPPNRTLKSKIQNSPGKNNYTKKRKKTCLGRVYDVDILDAPDSRELVGYLG